jgi:hypothetical protein
MARLSSRLAPSGFSQKYRLAEREGRLGNGAVGGLRRGDDDGLYLRVFNQLLPVARGAPEAVSGAVAFGRIRASLRRPFRAVAAAPVSNTAPTADIATAWALPM